MKRGRPKNKLDLDDGILRCCLCIRKVPRTHTYITEHYVKKDLNHSDDEIMTFFDIIEDLGLLSYEVNISFYN